MTLSMDTALPKAVADTFENLVFMEAFPVESGNLSSENDRLTVALLFHEPLLGEIRAEFPRQLLLLVASTVFGLEEDCSDSTLLDVSAELINTIAGRFLYELLPENQDFRIGLPEINPMETLDESENLHHWTFQVEGFPFAVLLNIFPCDTPTDQEVVAGGCPTC